MDEEITINVSEPWFTYIKRGKKRIEGRLNKGPFATLKKNNIIKFKNSTDDYVYCKCLKIVHYDTFEQYLSKEGLLRTLLDPTINTIEQGVSIYRQYYSEDAERQFKIIAIYIKKIKNIMLTIE